MAVPGEDDNDRVMPGDNVPTMRRLPDIPSFGEQSFGSDGPVRSDTPVYLGPGGVTFGGPLDDPSTRTNEATTNYPGVNAWQPPGTQAPMQRRTPSPFQRLGQSITNPLREAAGFLGFGGGAQDNSSPPFIPGDNLPSAINRQPTQFRYTQRDPITTLLDLGPEAVPGIQNRLRKAGYNVDVTGRVDSSTINALTDVMGQANVEGMTWGSMLDSLGSRFQSNNDAATQGRRRTPGVMSTPIFNPEAYVPPDYDTLISNIEAYADQQVGRELTDHEKTILADKYAALHRSSYDQQYAAAKAKFEEDVALQTQAFETEEGMRDAAYEGTGEGGVPETLVGERDVAGAQVDPAASFQQFFQEKYGDEIDRYEGIQEMMEDRDISVRNLMGMGSMINPSSANAL